MMVMTSIVYQTYNEHAPAGSIRCASPDPFCKNCKGTGVVYEDHPWGESVATETLSCSCVDAMISDATESVLKVIPLEVKTPPNESPTGQVIELLRRLAANTRNLMRIFYADAYLSPLYMERCARARLISARVDQIIELINELLMVYWSDKIAFDETCTELRRAALGRNAPMLNMLSGRVVGVVSLHPIKFDDTPSSMPF